MQQPLWERKGPPPPGVRTVDELTAELKRLVEGAFPRVSVEGEVVNARPSTRGHLYFDLEGQRATLPCVIFQGKLARLSRVPRNGDQMVCDGDVEIYAPHGRYQLVVSSVKLGGEGELLARFEELKRKLHAEGLFAPDRKRPLPRFPRRVGVVTSHTGAAIKDVVKSIHERYAVPILLAAAVVQGDDAPRSLRAALEAVASVPDVDVVVIGRGGGSLQDLWGFNDEQLTRAVAACPKPVVSAVGHEIDVVLTDYAADRRAPTPTAVGPMVVPSAAELRAGLDRLQHRAARVLGGAIRPRLQRLDELDGRLRRAASQRRRDQGARLADLQRRLQRVHPLARLERERAALRTSVSRLERAARTDLERRAARLERLSTRLGSMSPTGVLERGYAIVRRPDRTVVRGANEVDPGDRIEILLGQGAIGATVDDTDEEKR